ncbi:MAG TPA: hypothetical protein VE642_04345 [Pyrinomonadaceae bacterium]|nr:hypothetical protein [Pyrinomonadaceae bacterium]
MDEQAQKVTTGGGLSEARELAVWLRALQSFFDLADHPLAEAERSAVHERGFKCETAVVRDVLMRCLHLLGSVERGAGGVEGPGGESAPRAGSDAAPALAGVKPSLGELSDVLRDACGLAESLLESPSVSFAAWSGLGGVIVRELRRSEAAALIVAAGEETEEAPLQESLQSLARALASDELSDDVAAIFAGFTRLLALLDFVGKQLARDGQLKRLLPVFTLIQADTRALLDFIEGRALKVEGVERGAREILDGTAYAVRMELRKAFEHELVGFCSTRQPPQLFARVENAAGLLRDCYQQSVVALAQSFEPTLEGARLFHSFETKLEQSLALREDLWRLIRAVRRPAPGEEPPTQAAVVERLDAFRERSQRHLMYKDWEPLERFEEEVESARSPAQLEQTLHRFEAFLETLFGQVNMRVVLAAHPFDSTSVEP